MFRFPDEISVTDTVDSDTPEGTNTPAGEPADDFFSSWDKPAIKRPSNPPSRTGTPANANANANTSRTASPFLNPGTNGNGIARSKSPLSAPSAAPSESSDSKPATARAIPASAIRKTGAAQPRKTNVLGAKKKGLGAKKVDAAAPIDFDEAERKAREEEERIAKLGYDPGAEAAGTPSSPKAATAETNIVSPTPLSPGRTFGATKGHERSNSEVERLGMGIGRLGFGQVGAQKAAAAAAAAAKKPGFGAVSRPAATEGIYSLHYVQSTIMLTIC